MRLDREAVLALLRAEAARRGYQFVETVEDGVPGLRLIRPDGSVAVIARGGEVAWRPRNSKPN